MPVSGVNGTNYKGQDTRRRTHTHTHARARVINWFQWSQELIYYPSCHIFSDTGRRLIWRQLPYGSLPICRFFCFFTCVKVYECMLCFFFFPAKEVVVVVFQAYNYWAVGVGSLLGLLSWICWLQETCGKTDYSTRLPTPCLLLGLTEWDFCQQRTRV